jgi:hypothetical protein
VCPVLGKLATFIQISNNSPTNNSPTLKPPALMKVMGLARFIENFRSEFVLAKYKFSKSLIEFR